MSQTILPSVYWSEINTLHYYAKSLLKRFHLNGSTIGSGLPILKLQWQCGVGLKD